MLNILQLIVMFVSALLIIVADSIIKKISVQGNFMHALLNPWMFVVYALYLIQILLAIYVFMHHGELAIYVNLYIVFYSVLGVLTSFLVFGEVITATQGLGILLALLGAYLINSK